MDAICGFPVTDYKKEQNMHRKKQVIPSKEDYDE